MSSFPSFVLCSYYSKALIINSHRLQLMSAAVGGDLDAAKDLDPKDPEFAVDTSSIINLPALVSSDPGASSESDGEPSQKSRKATNSKTRKRLGTSTHCSAEDEDEDNDDDAEDPSPKPSKARKILKARSHDNDHGGDNNAASVNNDPLLIATSNTRKKLNTSNGPLHHHSVDDDAIPSRKKPCNPTVSHDENMDDDPALKPTQPAVRDGDNNDGMGSQELLALLRSDTWKSPPSPSTQVPDYSLGSQRSASPSPKRTKNKRSASSTPLSAGMWSCPRYLVMPFLTESTRGGS